MNKQPAQAATGFAYSRADFEELVDYALGHARTLGANRQNVQRIVNDLEKEELVAFETNPHHRRAQLVVLTDRGRQVYTAAMALQAPWINSLSDGVAVDDIKTMQKVMALIRQKLEHDMEDEEQG